MGPTDVGRGVRDAPALGWGGSTLTSHDGRSKVSAMADSRKTDPRRGSGQAGRKKGGATGARGRGFRFGPVNYAVLASGFGAIVLGYVLLDGGSVTAAPLLLILGYVVLLPLGILLGWKKLESTTEDRSRS